MWQPNMQQESNRDKQGVVFIFWCFAHMVPALPWRFQSWQSLVLESVRENAHLLSSGRENKHLIPRLVYPYTLQIPRNIIMYSPPRRVWHWQPGCSLSLPLSLSLFSWEQILKTARAHLPCPRSLPPCSPFLPFVLHATPTVRTPTGIGKTFQLDRKQQPYLLVGSVWTIEKIKF